MRYALQIFVMLGDLALVCASAFIIYFDPTNLFYWFLVMYAFMAWHKQGGFIAWNPKNIRQFFENARKVGL